MSAERLVPAVRDLIRAEISSAHGREVSFVARPDANGLIVEARVVARGTVDAVLAEEGGAPWVKYIHGDLGKGTWTFFGGHDPEDPQHQIGDLPTDLSLHPHSAGYRLILNNVLFPAAKKRELKT